MRAKSMGRAILRGWTHPPPGEPDLRRRGNLGVTLDGQTLASVQWDGDGCSISRASLSMMTDLTQGKSAEEIGRLYRDMEVMMHSRNLGVDDEILDELGDAAALGVHVPVRQPRQVRAAGLVCPARRDGQVRYRHFPCGRAAEQ